MTSGASYSSSTAALIENLPCWIDAGLTSPREVATVRAIPLGGLYSIYGGSHHSGGIAMTGLHALDLVIGSEWPSLATEADLRAFEATPYEERIAAQSTYEALKCGAARDPNTAALLF